jgi:hypothetical protein
MSGSQFNPDLGPAEMSATAPRVARIPSITQTPEIVNLSKDYHYVCPVASASMHTPDGTRISFLNGFYKTNIAHIVDYLESEIERGHSYITHASEDEINSFRMRTNPKEVLAEQARQDLEPKIRTELEIKIRAALANRLGISIDEVPGAEDIIPPEKDLQDPSESNLATVDLRSRLKNISMGGDTLITAGPAPLKGIVSSSQISEAAAGSAGNPGSTGSTGSTGQ